LAEGIDPSYRSGMPVQPAAERSPVLENEIEFVGRNRNALAHGEAFFHCGN
jgi:hypothetical protein